MRHMRAALALVCMALTTRCAGHKAREVLVQGCRGFDQVLAPMTEDINMIIDTDGESLECSTVESWGLRRTVQPKCYLRFC